MKFIFNKIISLSCWVKKMPLIGKLFIVGLFVLSFWFIYQNLIKKTAQPVYQTTKAERGAIVLSISASGQILIANTIYIATKAQGTVSTVFVKDGDRVDSGQEIAEIELSLEGRQKNSTAWANYLSAKNNYQTAVSSSYTLQSDMFSKWKIFTDLADSGNYDTLEKRNLPEFHIAEKNWLAAESKFKNQNLAISQAQASIDSAYLNYQGTSPVIYSPADGIIGNISIVPGIMLSSSSTTDTAASQRIAVIQNQSPPIISVNLSEIDVSKIKINQKATIIIDSLPDKTFTGKVASIDKIGSTVSNVTSYPCLVKFDNNSADILSNMAGSANIILTAKTDVLLVPSSAVQNESGAFFVKVLRSGKENRIPVETGISDGSYFEIISGLKEGEEVITGTENTNNKINNAASVFSSGGVFRTGGLGGSRR